MKDSDTILGLFFADENNVVYEKINYAQEMSEEQKDKLMMLPFNFFGPVFLTSASGEGSNWKIEFIESTLSFSTYKTESTTIQSLFNLNSSIETRDGPTNLFAIIGSPYTEDVHTIYKKIKEYIHPSIIQGKLVNQKVRGEDFKIQNFVNNELNRGLNFINFSLGTSRKMYWETQQKYYCIGVIERKKNWETKESESKLFTFDANDDLRRNSLKNIPSYYVLAILPKYYEHLTNETLEIFGMSNINSNLRQIELRFGNKEVIYLEEFNEEKGKKISYGVILIPVTDQIEDLNNISTYKKNLRIVLDGRKELLEVLKTINSRFTSVEWGCDSEKELNELSNALDK